MTYKPHITPLLITNYYIRVFLMKKIITFGSSLILFLIFFAAPSYAAIMSLDPASYSAPVRQTFTVKLTIDTEGESIDTTDAILLYDSSVLQVVDVVTGDNGQNPFLPDFYKNISPDEIYIGHSVIDMLEPKSGQGILATITFRGNAAGLTNVRFDCTPGKTSDTNISKSDKNETDIVECARLTPGTYTIGSGNPTPVPEVGGPVIPTATPQPIPTTGSFDVTTAALGMGILLVLFAVGGKVLLKI